MSLLSVATVINNILLVKYGAAAYGADIPLAAFVVIMKLFQIVLNIAIGIAAGAQPIVGYNYGAKKFSRVRELLGLIVKWTSIVCLVCTVLFESVPLFFIQMFGADGELYTQFAVQCLRIYSSLILFTCVQAGVVSQHQHCPAGSYCSGESHQHDCRYGVLCHCGPGSGLCAAEPGESGSDFYPRA